MRKIKSLCDVVDWGLCTGCGACQAFCEKNAVALRNVKSVGIRPELDREVCGDCKECLAICPGYRIDAALGCSNDMIDGPRDNLFIGTFQSLWEGFAADSNIRFAGSSGGVLTALASFCLEKEKMNFVVHTGMHPKKPWRNESLISRTRVEILQNAGSRYCTSSPCELLRKIEDSDNQCVFIGKPCDVAAVNMARQIRPRLDKNLGLVLSFFCAGTPCEEATVDLVHDLGIDREDIKFLKYRGQGWPGMFKVESVHQKKVCEMTYMESWAEVSKRRPFRCHICPDGLGQMADITSGDAWNKYTGPEDSPGRSHVIARTIRGKKIVEKAVEAGYLNMKSIFPEDIEEAQGLIERRKVVYGRLLGMKFTGMPVTEFVNFRLKEAWLKNKPGVMLRTILGTQKRVIQRGMWHKNALFL